MLSVPFCILVIRDSLFLIPHAHFLVGINIETIKE